MLLRRIIIYVLFLILPIISVFIHVLGNGGILSSWDLVNVALSFVFTTAFKLRKEKISKVMLGIILLSLLVQEISMQLINDGLTFSTLLLLILTVFYKAAIALVLFHYLIKPTFYRMAHVERE